MWDFTYDGVSAATKGFVTNKILIPDLPDAEEALINIPNQDGLVQIGKKFNARIIRIKGILEGSSFADLLTKIEAFNLFIFSQSDKQIIASYQTDRYYLGQKIKKEEIDKGGFSCDRDIQFKCNDPFGYAVTPNDNDETGIVVDGYQWTETYTGQYPVFPVITITFNQSQTHIYLSNTSVDGCRIDITKSFVNTDSLEISGRDVSIRLNDVNSPAGLGDGGDEKAQFPLLRIGANLMEIGTTDPTLDVDINVNYRKIFL